MRNTEKAESEIKDLGFEFKYRFDDKVVGKLTFCVEKNSIKEIISFFEKDELLIFLLNDGKTAKTYKNWKPQDALEFIYNEHYDNSIYWENDLYGDCIRVDSDMGGVDRFVDQMSLIERIKKIKKIKNNIV